MLKIDKADRVAEAILEHDTSRRADKRRHLARRAGGARGDEARRSQALSDRELRRKARSLAKAWFERERGFRALVADLLVESGSRDAKLTSLEVEQRRIGRELAAFEKMLAAIPVTISG